ncbi:hypothetical protein BDV33DRAFT_201763 [Aspergillus novoparasiticus]|uniref:Uncharacterized protein n=1 Tax=Aspergillus novoparasiticus TaxID=986946 RepID=A0A5N6EXJ9_9EURO|nr:hypothetical protein BDV33DRAFT_201763 [Aspergillus novoparasiticus]
MCSGVELNYPSLSSDLGRSKQLFDKEATRFNLSLHHSSSKVVPSLIYSEVNISQDVVAIRLEDPPEDDNDLARDPGTKEGPLIDFIRNVVEREGFTVEDSEYLPGPGGFPPQFLIGVKINDDIYAERFEQLLLEQWFIKGRQSNDPFIPVDFHVEGEFDF